MAALLKVAEQVDSQPQKLNELLPDRGERTAFRGAVRIIQNLSQATDDE